MNVLFLANGGTLYGANRSMIDLLAGLMSQGDNVFVLLPTRGNIVEELRKKKIPYKIVEYKLSVHNQNEKFCFERITDFIQNIACSRKIIKIIKEWNINVVHINSVVIDIGAISAVLSGVPYVWHVREMLDKDYELQFNTPLLQKILMRHASKIIFISKAVRKNFKGYSNNNAIVLYNGFDTNNYEIIRDIYFKNDEINLLLCGMIIKGKGQMDAIQAVKLLIEKGYPVSLNIVGSVADVKYLEEMKDYISKNNLESKIHILPFEKDLCKIRVQSDIALMCSENEALGRVTIEGMLSELVVVGTNSGGTSEIIQDGYNGYLYKSHDIEGLVKKIAYVINNKEEAVKIAKNSRIFAKKKFDYLNYASLLHEIYAQINSK